MDTANSRQRGDMSCVPVLLRLLPSPSASPLCARAEEQGDGAGLWMSVGAFCLEVTNATAMCGQ